MIKKLKMCHSIALSARLRVQNNDRTIGQEWISATTSFCRLSKIHCTALDKSWAIFCSSYSLYEWLHNIDNALGVIDRTKNHWNAIRWHFRARTTILWSKVYNWFLNSVKCESQKRALRYMLQKMACFLLATTNTLLLINDAEATQSQAAGKWH